MYIPDIIDFIESFVERYLENSEDTNHYHCCNIEDAYKLLADCIKNNTSLIIPFMVFIRHCAQFNEDEMDLRDIEEYMKSEEVLNTLYDEIV